MRNRRVAALECASAWRWPAPVLASAWPSPEAVLASAWRCPEAVFASVWQWPAVAWQSAEPVLASRSDPLGDRHDDQSDDPGQRQPLKHACTGGRKRTSGIGDESGAHGVEH